MHSSVQLKQNMIYDISYVNIIVVCELGIILTIITIISNLFIYVWSFMCVCVWECLLFTTTTANAQLKYLENATITTVFVVLGSA